MNQSYLTEPTRLHLALEAERPRLVRLCTYWLGDGAAAEDVVQETLLEAWRKIENLREPEAFRGWLSGIARNMSLRRLQRLGRELARRQPENPLGGEPIVAVAEIPADFDFEVELDRADLARLLEQAMELLPDETRTILIQKYIEEASHQAIADALGISENVVAVRLHRGKLALRKVLSTELEQETAAFGLLTEEDRWQVTRIWCTSCGQRRLMGRLNEQEFVLRCPDCNIEPTSYHSQSGREDPFIGEFRTFRPALKRFSALMHDRFQQAIREGFLACGGCGRAMPLHYRIAHYAPPSVQASRGMHVYCYDCNMGAYESLDGLALNLPEGQQFFQANPRLETLPLREIEHQGRAAIVVPFAAVNGPATLDVIVTEETYETLSIVRKDG